MNGTFLWTIFCALLPLEMKVVWVLFLSGLASFLLSQHRPFYPCLAMHVPFAQQRCLQQLATPLEYTPTVYPPRTPSPTVYIPGSNCFPPNRKNQLKDSLLMEQFPDLLEYNNSPKGCSLIVGDFNFHYYVPTNTYTSRLIDLLDSFKYLLSKLQKVQNNAARLIFRTTRSAHVNPMFHSLHWLPIEQRIEYKLSLLCFKIISHQAPIYLSELLHLYKEVVPAAPHFYRHSSVQNTILPNKVLWSCSALSLTRIQLSGTNSLLLSAIQPLSALLNLP